MRRSIGRIGLVVGGVAGVAGMSWVRAAPVAAHPIDELLQQVYVTPTASGIDIDLELTAGVQVAPDFVTVIDSDGDGQISKTEADAHAAVVLSTLMLKIDGQRVATRLVDSTYPDEALMAAGGGTIVLAVTADAAPTGSTRMVTVANAYAPASTTSGPLLTSVQVNLTPDVGTALEVESIDHASDGRTLTARYDQTVSAATSGVAQTQSGDGLDGDNQASASTSAVANAIGGRWVLTAALTISASFGLFVLLRRRRSVGAV